MPEYQSPLPAIQQKEAEVRHRLEAARQQAVIRLEAAGQQAQQCRSQAEQAGRLRAKALYEQELAQTRQQALTLVTDAQTQADTLQQQAMAQLNDAVEQVLGLVLPKESVPPQS